MKRDLLTILDLTPEEISKLFRRSSQLKKLRLKKGLLTTLKGRTLAMLFEKASTRTRVSFEVAMRELGGSAVYLERGTTQVGRGESYSDTAKVLSCYCHGILIRTFGHSIAEEVAGAASVSVINGLTDLYHPCQVLSDLFTVREIKKDFRKICYVGDGSNMANTWILASLLLKFSLAVATPISYSIPPVVMERVRSLGLNSLVITQDPVEAVKGADVINTDTWFSMGQEKNEEKRRSLLPYQVNRELLRHARPDAIVLHSLPAYRGEEITAEVLDGPRSRIWQQAENRLHVQKAILEMFLK